MQTFLPFESFTNSALCLDDRRLGKQRVEVLQILNALRDKSGWSNHPAVKMWRGCEGGLALYGMEICNEWIRRGFKDTVLDKIRPVYLRGPINLPVWLGREDFHLSHQSNLLRKNLHYYRPWFPYTPTDLPYVWPLE